MVLWEEHADSVSELLTVRSREGYVYRPRCWCEDARSTTGAEHLPPCWTSRHAGWHALDQGVCSHWHVSNLCLFYAILAGETWGSCGLHYYVFFVCRITACGENFFILGELGVKELFWAPCFPCWNLAVSTLPPILLSFIIDLHFSTNVSSYVLWVNAWENVDSLKDPWSLSSIFSPLADRIWTSVTLQHRLMQKTHDELAN